MDEKTIRRLTDKEAERLIRLYERGEYRIQSHINTALLRGSDPAYLQQVKANITTARKELLAGSRTWCEKSVPFLYREGVSFADEMAFSTHLAAGFGTLHQEAASVLAEATYSRMKDVDLVVGRQVDDLFRSLQLEYAQGTVLGAESTKAAAKAMREDLARRGITGFFDKRGRQWTLKNYTEMCIHDVSMQSFREGTRIRLLEYNYDLVIISSHSGSCPKCEPYQGRTFSLTGTSDKFPPLSDARSGGLFHPRCRHIYTLSPEEKNR
ncbi:MAG: phage minor capsid protein [Bacteroidales bacterium]